MEKLEELGYKYKYTGSSAKNTGNVDEGDKHSRRGPSGRWVLKGKRPLSAQVTLDSYLFLPSFVPFDV
ncbi:hypothetical protein QFC20_003698 [Naganishia adeliensis]|uniref:Uncharacterized protein n=1 Tax=Naganishia adeliensis TaxID=92952 RepID=A0ACC2W7P7_9TREE|nr:hypothetical protein QFC20_003698 [Naganishia adeliensis]